MRPSIDPVQESYAALLSWLVRIGLLLMFVAFALYALGLVPASVSLESVPDLWTLSAEEFSAEAGVSLGWTWVGNLSDGRVLAFAALVVFPAGTVLLIGIAVGLYMRHRSAIYAIVAALEFIVLVVAATGLLGGAH